MIRFNNYSKQYNNTLIIQANMELDGKFYWLRGENGSGKTTLIKSIAGLIPFDGEIAVDGISINKDRIGYRMIVNYAEAEPVFPTFLTGTDLIKFYAETKKADKQQVDALVATMGIAGFMGNKTGTYSSGMLKKLSLVLGFMGRPKLVLLDEPLITLDHQSVSNLVTLIQDCVNSGTTFIITSHQEVLLDREPAARLSIAGNTLICGQ